MKTRIMFVFVLLNGVGGLSLAQEKRLQVYDGTIQRIDPVRTCGARLMDDGRVIATTEWRTYERRIDPAGGSDLDCWDAFGNDGMTGAPAGGDECGLPHPDSRWYFGPEYVNAFFAGNWDEGVDGKTGEPCRTQFAWYVSATDTFVYGLFTGRNQPGDCTYTVDYNGVVYDFGTMTPGAWYTDVDFSICDLIHELDDDGQGSYVGMLAYDFDGSRFYLSSVAQPLMWSANATSGGVPLVGTNHGIELDDNNPPDGVLDPVNECYDYTGRVTCPDPLQAMVGFGRCSSGPRCPSEECSGVETLAVKGKIKGGQCQSKAIMKHGLPNSAYGIVSPTGNCNTVSSNLKGKAVVKEFPSGYGTASVPTCGVSFSFTSGC